jgi:prepilin-type N-terminal cleavage/methylation domain-containing protein/prepilin-type processing-associated H-X9-DG protein
MRKRGFTIVELLMVIAIIGIIVSLLIPAIQAAREAARRVQCIDHLKQLALGCANHESSNKILPTNGWCFAFLGHPDCGKGITQPGGWIYNVLPYIEEGTLYRGEAGLTGNELKAAAATLMQTPVGIFYCPSRRSAALYPNLAVKLDAPLNQVQSGYVPLLLGGDGQTTILYDPSSSTRVLGTDVPSVVRSDYAANGYDILYFASLMQQCPVLATAINLAVTNGPPAVIAALNDPMQMRAISAAVATTNAGKGGVFCTFQAVTMADIRDGTSNTYLIGEKFMDPDHYTDGAMHGDQWNAFIGEDPDITRYCRTGQYGRVSQDSDCPVPVQFEPGIFGSAHPGAFNMAFCDCSVHSLSYGISATVHDALGNRDDGTSVDASQLNP